MRTENEGRRSNSVRPSGPGKKAGKCSPSVPVPPPLALARGVSQSGCGRMFPMVSRVMREGLSIGFDPRAGGAYRSARCRRWHARVPDAGRRRLAQRRAGRPSWIGSTNRSVVPARDVCSRTRHRQSQLERCPATANRAEPGCRASSGGWERCAVGRRPGTPRPSHDLRHASCGGANVSPNSPRRTGTLSSSTARRCASISMAPTARGGRRRRAMGRSRGGPTPKIQPRADAEGRPVALTLTQGQAHDGRSAVDLVADVGPDHPHRRPRR